MTLILIFFTLYFTSRAFKQLISLQTTIEAIFNKINLDKIANFEIKKPEVRRNSKSGKKSKRDLDLLKFYEKLEMSIIDHKNRHSSLSHQISTGFKNLNYLVYTVVHTLFCCRGACFENGPGCCCCKKNKNTVKFQIMHKSTVITSVSYQLSFFGLWVILCIGAAMVDYLNLNLQNRRLQYYILGGSTLFSFIIGIMIQHFFHQKYKRAVSRKITQIFMQAHEEARLLQSQDSESQTLLPLTSHRKQQSKQDDQIYSVNMMVNSQEKNQTLLKLLLTLTLICFAFSISIYIIMKLRYEMKIYLMAAYVGAIFLDLVFVRNVVIFVYFFNKALVMKIANKLSKTSYWLTNSKKLKNSKQRKNFAFQNQNSQNMDEEIYNSQAYTSQGLTHSQKHLMETNPIIAQNIENQLLDDNSNNDQIDASSQINKIFKSIIHLDSDINFDDNLIDQDRLKQHKDIQSLIKGNYDLQLKILELALFSFINQTYGKKSIQILKTFKKQVKDFDLIDEIKSKLQLKINQKGLRASQVEGDNVYYSPLKAYRDENHQDFIEDNDIEMQEFIGSQFQQQDTFELRVQTQERQEKLNLNIVEEDQEEIKNDFEHLENIPRVSNSSSNYLLDQTTNINQDQECVLSIQQKSDDQHIVQNPFDQQSQDALSVQDDIQDQEKDIGNSGSSTIYHQLIKDQEEIGIKKQDQVSINIQKQVEDSHSIHNKEQESQFQQQSSQNNSCENQDDLNQLIMNDSNEEITQTKKKRRILLPQHDPIIKSSQVDNDKQQIINFTQSQQKNSTEADQQVQEINLRKKRSNKGKKKIVKNQLVNKIEKSETEKMSGDCQEGLHIQSQIIENFESQLNQNHNQIEQIDSQQLHILSQQQTQRATQFLECQMILQQHPFQECNFKHQIQNANHADQEDFNMIEFYEIQTRNPQNQQQQQLKLNHSLDEIQEISATDQETPNDVQNRIQFNQILPQIEVKELKAKKRQIKWGKDSINSQMSQEDSQSQEGNSNLLQTGRITQAESNINDNGPDDQSQRNFDRLASYNAEIGGFTSTVDFYPLQLRTTTASQGKPPLKSHTQRMKNMQINQSGTIKRTETENNIINSKQYDILRPSTQMNKDFTHKSKNILFNQTQESVQNSRNAILNDLQEIDDIHSQDVFDNKVYVNQQSNNLLMNLSYEETSKKQYYQQEQQQVAVVESRHSPFRQDQSFNLLDKSDRSPFQEREKLNHLNNLNQNNEIIQNKQLSFLNNNNIQNPYIHLNTSQNQRSQSHDRPISQELNMRNQQLQYQQQQNHLQVNASQSQFKKSRDSHSVEAELKRKAYLKFSGLSQVKNPYEKQPQNVIKHKQHSQNSVNTSNHSGKSSQKSQIYKNQANNNNIFII
eukprot:403349336